MTLRKLGMSPAQCSVGLRIHNLIDRNGLDENPIESFLSTVYTKCQDLGVNPDHIVKYIGELVSLLEGRTNQQQHVVSIQEIDAIFEKKKQANIELQEEAKRLFCERNLEELAEKKRRLESDLKWNSNLRDELKKLGLADNISKVVEAARFFNDGRFSLEEMLMKFSSFKGMENAILDQERQLEILRKKSRSLEEMIQHQDGLPAERKLKNRELDELKEMGFGLWDLKVLRNLVTELAIENGQPTQNGVAVKKFVSDIESHYPDYLRLRERVSHLAADEKNLRATIGEIGYLGTSVRSFLSRNPTQNDIREVTKLLEGYPKTSFAHLSLSKKNQEHSESGVEVIGSTAVHSDGIDREKVSVATHLEVKEDYPQENLPTFFNDLHQEYVLSPDRPENIDTSTRPSNLQSQDKNHEKKRVTRHRTPPPSLPPLPDPRGDEDDGATN